MNWRIRMSLKLLGTPHRKKSAVTRMNGSIRPAGINGASMSSCCDGEFPCPAFRGPLSRGSLGPTEKLKVHCSFCSALCIETPAPRLFFSATCLFLLERHSPLYRTRLYAGKLVI